MSIQCAGVWHLGSRIHITHVLQLIESNWIPMIPVIDGGAFQTSLQHVRQSFRIYCCTFRPVIGWRTDNWIATAHPFPRLGWGGSTSTIPIPHHGHADEFVHIGQCVGLFEMDLWKWTPCTTIRLLQMCGQHSRWRNTCRRSVRGWRTGISITIHTISVHFLIRVISLT